MTKSRAVRITGFFALVSILFKVIEVSGQECLCPTQIECRPCTGGINSLTLLYHGSQPLFISINDSQGEVFSGAISSGQTFTFTSSNPNESFSGSFLEIYALLELQTQINIQCNSLVIGQAFG